MKTGSTRFLLASFMALVLAGAWFSPLEDAAKARIDAGFARALASFATARALNAVLSPIQGVELSFQPFGVGTSVAIGQFLRPINELIGQFAELMLAASIAFGAMKVLVIIGSYWMVSLLMSAVALGWAWYRWRGQPPPRLVESLLFVLLFIRFAMPVIAVGSDVVFQKFMQADYATTQKALDGSHGALRGLAPSFESDPAGKGLADQTRAWWSRLDPAEWAAKLKAFSSQVVEHIIRLVVVFLMQTLVIPLLLLWVLYRGARAIVFSPGARI